MAVVVAVAVGWAGSLTRPFTVDANLLVFGSAAPVLVLAVLQRAIPGRLPAVLRRHPVAGDIRQTLRRAWPWYLIVAGTLVLELVDLSELPRRLHPTISSLVAPLLHGGGRWVAVTLWLLLGAWMVGQ